MHAVSMPAGITSASAAAQVTNKGIGSVIGTLTITVTTSATSSVGIADSVTGAGPTPLVPANTPVGVYNITLNCVSRRGDWWINTATGVSVIVTTPHPHPSRAAV